MRPLFVLCYLLLVMTEGFAVSCKPRRSVFFKDMNLKLFKESNFGNLSSLMLRDDIDQLVLGGREKVLTLSLADVTKKTGEVHWRASSAEKNLCQKKGKSTEDCDNFIRVIHMMKDGKMLVCGTNAFNPLCDYMHFDDSQFLYHEDLQGQGGFDSGIFVGMTFTNGIISLERNWMTGKGKLPYDPHQRFASLMYENTLYSAASVNFQGTDIFFQKHGLNPIKTENKRSWMNDPTMISISLVEASRHSDNGEDDLVFLFFTENAVEERRSNLQVSRVARVCKSDLGGRRILQHKWTSFLKARLDCPFGDVGSSPLVRDVFLLQNQSDWMDSIFYATFTSNPELSGASSHSAVCAYKLSDISKVFSGKFLTETNSGSWDIYTNDEPSPHPSTCINNEMRARDVNTSLDLSDTILMFVKNHPLMEGVVPPITGTPLLVHSSKKFSKIVIDQVTLPDGQQHHMMLIGTESGWLLKAVNLDGKEGRIIEELQLFEDQLPVKFLQISTKTGQLYSGVSNAAVQVDIRDCRRYTSCDDCIIARDPYCGWDQMRGKCASAAVASSWFQSLSDGDTSICSTSNLTKRPDVVHLTINITQFLPCHPDTNLPVSWRFSDSIIHRGPRHNPISQGLVIKPFISDAGVYTCETVENVKGKTHQRMVSEYLVQVQDSSSHVRKLEFAVIALGVIAGVLLMCNFLMCFKLKA